MKKIALAALIAAAITPSLALAEAGDFVVRLRAVDVAPDESSKLGSYLGGANAGTKLEVNSNVIPEIDFSYYITKNIAAELILATGTRHDVKIGGTGTLAGTSLGSVNLLPPTLTLQWHFLPDQTFDPYVGAGLNYTLGMDRSLTLTNPGDIKIDRNMFGPVLQAGFDVNLKDGWLINADVKKVWMNTQVKLNGAQIDSLDIDPWIIGVGFGKKF
ncbi:outer membrane protein W precursor [mine drainage metagenome]|uniref:Outer membrane protein W n=1 Tax=mine drainage metagenome TaxID=410659 RepID=A0A1J5QSN5_9ZZZZ